MAANVETMMYAGREVPWHGLGTQVDSAPTSADAIRLAGLDWTVNGEPIFDANGKEIKGFKANTRSSDNSILGIVSDRYKIVQNNEAFEFTDSLVGAANNVFYETAGSLKNGKQIWLLAKMPTMTVAGDDVDPYVCFTNTHDGSGSIRVCMTPVRVVCNNTLNLALSTANRSWSTKHMGDMAGKIHEARITLGLANTYMNELANVADTFVNQKITDAEIEDILNELFPVDLKNDSERKVKNVQELKDNYYVCYMMPDIAKFRGTKWGAIQAMADMTTHMKPSRNTDSYQENNWGRIIYGHPIMDAFMKRVA